MESHQIAPSETPERLEDRANLPRAQTQGYVSILLSQACPPAQLHGALSMSQAHGSEERGTPALLELPFM